MPFRGVPYFSMSPNIKLKTQQKISAGRIAERNPNWKGNNVRLAALHEWVTARKLKPLLCEECKKKPPHDLANISQEYKRDLTDWEWLCRACHMTKDGRLVNLHNGNRK